MRRDGQILDTAAIRVYNQCVAEYGFRRERAYLFGQRKPLYAEEATREEYNVLMACYSNFIDDNWHSGRRNIFYRTSYRYEWQPERVNTELEGRYHQLGHILVAFYKDEDGGYKFYGVLECVEINLNDHYIRYKLISEEYPFVLQ